MKTLRLSGFLIYQISQIQRLEELKSILKYFRYSEVVNYNGCAFKYLFVCFSRRVILNTIILQFNNYDSSP